MIPGTTCCAESPRVVGGRPTYERIPDRGEGSAKRGGAGLDGGGKRGRDDDGNMSDFGKNKKTRSFQTFRKAYKKNHPGVSDHTVLVKYLAGLVRLRNI
jgi:hypothetical protein